MGQALGNEVLSKSIIISIIQCSLAFSKLSNTFVIIVPIKAIWSFKEYLMFIYMCLNPFCCKNSCLFSQWITSLLFCNPRIIAGTLSQDLYLLNPVFYCFLDFHHLKKNCLLLTIAGVQFINLQYDCFY